MATLQNSQTVASGLFGIRLDSVDSGGIDVIGKGQSFHVGTSYAITTCDFSLYRFGSPTGNIVAKIYTHTGTFGTSSLPTGSALATSDTIDVTTITSGSYNIKTFSFSGANLITLSGNTNYVVTLEFSGGNSTNWIGVNYDNSTLTDPGNCVTLTTSTWSVDSAKEMVYYIYGNTISSDPQLINITSISNITSIKF